jgi:hypothetical protein
MQKAPFLVVFTLVIVVAALFVTLLGQDILANRSTDNRSYAAEQPVQE